MDKYKNMGINPSSSRPAIARTGAPITPIQSNSVQQSGINSSDSEKKETEDTTVAKTEETTTPQKQITTPAKNLDSILNNNQSNNSLAPLALAVVAQGIAGLVGNYNRSSVQDVGRSVNPSTPTTQTQETTKDLDIKPLAKDDFVTAAPTIPASTADSSARENLRSNFDAIVQSNMGAGFTKAFDRFLLREGIDTSNNFDGLKQVPDDKLAELMSKALFSSGFSGSQITSQDLLTNPNIVKTKLEQQQSQGLAFGTVEFGYDV